MNIPNVPTDSLYKFMALAGTVIIIVSVYITFSHLDTLQEKTISVNTDIAILNIKLSALESEVDEAVKEIDKINTKYNLTKNKFTKEEADTETKNSAAALSQKTQLYEIEREKLYANHTRVEMLYDKTRFVVIGNIMVILIGLVLQFLGFWFWYIKIQIPLDLLLKNQVLESEQARKKSYNPFGRKK